MTLAIAINTPLFYALLLGEVKSSCEELSAGDGRVPVPVLAPAWRHSESTGLSWKLLRHLTGSDSSLAAEGTDTDSTQRMWLRLAEEEVQQRVFEINGRITKQTARNVHADVVDIRGRRFKMPGNAAGACSVCFLF